MCFPPIIASSVGNKFVSRIKRWGVRSVCAVQKRTRLKIAVLEIGLVLKAPYQSGLNLLPAEELDFLKVYFLQQAGEIKTCTHTHIILIYPQDYELSIQINCVCVQLCFFQPLSQALWGINLSLLSLRKITSWCCFIPQFSRQSVVGYPWLCACR